tara:strand:- start:331 stop:498 length:168 start_codon:yes stop_codon:yes gene_type:complete
MEKDQEHTLMQEKLDLQEDQVVEVELDVYQHKRVVHQVEVLQNQLFYKETVVVNQ